LTKQKNPKLTEKSNKCRWKVILLIIWYPKRIKEDSDQKLEHVNTNQAFIDRSGDLFRYLLEYMRGCDEIILNKNDNMEELINEAEYYQLSGMAQHFSHASTDYPSSIKTWNSS
jgi:hypothetical protein